MKISERLFAKTSVPSVCLAIFGIDNKGFWVMNSWNIIFTVCKWIISKVVSEPLSTNNRDRKSWNENLGRKLPLIQNET